ncbi:MAG: glycoside hydrolase family 127 protein [Suipraeoptans sp.]
MLTNTINSKNAKVKPISFNNVAWTKGFWKDVENNNSMSTIPQLEHMFTSKDISHVLENFKICAGESTGSFDGTVFGDGDFYKWMEAAIYTAAKTNDSELFLRLDEYIDLIGRAQLPDGYISTKQIIGERESDGAKRGGDINDFEVYNFGHLFTTACIHKRITGKDTLLNIARKAADYLSILCKKNIENNDVQTAVCPSHFMGIVELYRTTKDDKYLELAQLAISMRDNVENGLDDNQDRLPVKEHSKIIGHAVRANYLYAGIADLCLEETDKTYTDVLDKVWNNLVNTKMYITGGCGALYNGASPYGNFFNHQLVHQAYGYEYQLPNVTAYNETCASVGSVMWAYRMFQLDPKASYFDIIERTMLNVNLAAVSLDGKKFFYENMLRRAKKLPYELVWPLTRSEYILSYCCPPNISRMIAQSSEYAYTVSDDGIWTGLYGASTANISLNNGASFTLTQETDYPYSGAIKFKITDVSGEPFKLHIRIPSWVNEGTITTHKILKLSSDDAGTYIEVKVCGEMEIDLDFFMHAGYTITHSLVEEDTNQVAVERGPIVYCIEGDDTNLDTLNDLMMDPDATFTPVDYEIMGRKMKALETDAYHIVRNKYNADSLYQPLSYSGVEKTHIRMIPYFAWDNRDLEGEMKIWMPLLFK